MRIGQGIVWAKDKFEQILIKLQLFALFKEDKGEFYTKYFFRPRKRSYLGPPSFSETGVNIIDFFGQRSCPSYLKKRMRVWNIEKFGKICDF